MLVVCTDKNGTAWVGNGVTRTKITDSAIFDRYVLVWKGRFVNTSQQPVSGWGNVVKADDLVLATLGKEV